MRLRRTARSSTLALALVAGLTVPPAAWSTTDPPPTQSDEAQPDAAQAELELAEELGHEVGSPELEEAIAEAAEQTAAPFGAAAAGVDAEANIFAEESETGLWIVQLEADPLATYDGGVRGLSATSPQATGGERVDVSSAQSRAYLAHLQDEQADALVAMAEELGHDIEVARTYQHAINGMAVEVSAEEAAALAELPGVAQVEPEQVWQLETDVSNDILGSPAIWGGDTGSDLATYGEGVITGMIDSGVNPDHPSFAATDGEGYTHTNPLGEGVYLGVCAEDADPFCNDKLIGAYDYSGTGAVDTDGHGSHVGSTMAGNMHDAVFTVGETEFTRQVSGVAPRANVISYKVCGFFGCPSTATVAAVDQAIADGTDVLNYSISGPDNPWNNAVDQAFLSAFEAGIYIAASAGNTGPGFGTVTKTAPWNATVAATNSPRLIAQALSVTAPGPVPGELEEMAAVPGSGPGVTSPIEAPLREVEGNVQGCTAFEDGVFDGAIALVERGDCEFGVKVGNAAAAGALGVVMSNQMPGPPVVMGGLEDTTVPAVMISLEEGQPLRDFVRANDGVEVLLDSAAVLSDTPEWAGIVADFSGRGPSSFDLLNPTFAAPGRNILAATAASGEDAATYEFMQGTSMSSPHGAGSGALIRGLHPDWSPAMIRSALASTADPEGMLKDDGVTPADAFDVGSGMVDLEAAGRVGLVMDETHANFLAADPSTGGDPSTLNLPAIVDQACDDTCSFERTVTSVADAAATYTVTTSGDDGLQVSVEPSTFTIEPGATQVLSVTVDVSGDSTGEWLMGSVQVTTDGTHANGAQIADVHYPVTALAANPTIAVSPDALDSTLGVDEQAEHTVTVSNVGTAPLEWQVTEEGDVCTLPGWVGVDPSSGTVAEGSSAEVLVTFDSSDLAGGDYSATLCLDSNDLAAPVAQVELSLEVVEIPVIGVDPTDVDVIVPLNGTATETVEVTNTGYGVLDWTFADPEAGPSQERIQHLRDGVLLVPNSASNHRGVMAFDPQDGTLIDEAFIPHHAFHTSTLYTPNHVLPNADGTGFLIADQIRHVITEYDLDGRFKGFFAPSADGNDPDIMTNIRGMAWSPQGTLVVTVASGVNGNSVVEFDAEGNFLGFFIEPGLDDMAGPWFVTFRDDDVLVSTSGSEAIHSFSIDGTTANPRFVGEIRWPEQIEQTPEGNVLVANWNTRADTPPRGIHEYSATGEHLGHYVVPGSNSYAGVHPLGNGNILTTTEDGVFEIDRTGELVEQEQGEGRGRFISKVQLPDLAACQTPDEIPWLDVDPLSGSNVRDETTEVELTFTPEGMDEGTHTARLCVSSNDEMRPYVPVDVSMTVTEAQAPTCDTTIDGRVNGGLTVTGAVCVEPGAVINGGVTVRSGATLFMDGARVNGGLTSVGARWLEVTDNRINGGATITGTTDVLVFEGNDVKGGVRIYDNPAID